LADDFKTINGKEYKNATVTRVEPDGIMIKFSGGLVKIPFSELSDEFKQKYHYDREAAQKFAAETATHINALNAVAPTTPTRRAQEEPDRRLESVMIFAVIKPFHYGQKDTTAHIQQYEKYWEGPTIYDFNWRKVGNQFTGVIDEPMPEYYEEGDVIPVAIYRIGHRHDSSRHPLFTTDKEKAMQVMLGGD